MIFLPRVTAIWSSELNLPTPIHFTLVILNRLVFTLAIYLTTFSLPWFMDLTFQVAMPYCSLQHQVLFSPPDTSINEHHFHFSPAASFFLELLVIALLSFSVAYATHSDLRSSSSDVVSFFLIFKLFLVFWQQEYQSGSAFPHPVEHLLSELFIMACLGWPCMAWLRVF